MAKNLSQRELRKWCVERALDSRIGMGIDAGMIVKAAEKFEAYLVAGETEEPDVPEKA